MKRTLLLGAGAAAGCYEPALTTGSITAAFLEVPRWQGILARYRTLMGSGNSIDPNDIIDLVSKLLARKSSATFEELIEGIDKVSSFHFSNDSKVFHVLLLALGVKRAYPNTVWTEVPFLARQLVAEFVFSSTRSSACSALEAGQRSFLAALKAEGPTCVYSLNYDETLYESVVGLGLDNGFRGEYFSVGEFLSAESVVAFPHGHVRYLHNGREGVTYEPDAARANYERFARLVSSQDETLAVVDHPYAYVFDTFLVTGQMKDHALDRNPYAATYQRLALDISTSDELILIGYGLADRHLNRLITNYLAQDPAHKILIVTKHDGPVDVYAGYGPNGWSHTLLTTLGVNSLPLTGPDWDNLKYRYAGEVAMINKIGYGTIYPGIRYYKEGYERFLSEFQQVLEPAKSSGPAWSGAS